MYGGIDMKENDVEKALYKMRDAIPVNKQLQEDLRNEFINNSKHNEKARNKDSTKYLRKSSPGRWFKHLPKVAAILILCLGIYMLAGITENGNILNYVSAASLNVSNYMSFVDVNIGSGTPISVSEYNGSLYIAVFGSDLYEYSDSGLKVISKLKSDKELHSEIQWVRVSPDGSRLVYLSTQGIGIYNIKTQESNLVLKHSDDGLTYYIEPTWHPDENGIIYTKQVIKPGEIHGFEIAESGIYYLNLESMESEKLADGSHGSYVKGKNAIVFERDGMLILKSLKENNEQIIDEGRYPSVSPCGNYVAYIKFQKHIKKPSEDNTSNNIIKEGVNAEIHESIENIWIADVSNFKNKKQITSNDPYYFISETEWLQSLEPSELKQVLSVSGRYSYYSPVWSSDSKNIYAIRSKNVENLHETKIIKIELSAGKEEKEFTVERYLQALILRDEDYAKSLMKNPPELLTISNPRYVGFKILESSRKQDKNQAYKESESDKAGEYVDAEVYLSYTAHPYFMIEKSRYYLSSHESGYIIDNIEPLENIQVYEKNGVVYLEKELKNQAVAQSENPIKLELFKQDDIPVEFLPDVPFRFSCLAYYNPEDTTEGTDGMLIFTLQTFDNGQQNTNGKSKKPSVSLLSYSLKEKNFKLIDKISEPSGGIMCTNLTINSTGQYAAMDLFMEGPQMKNYTLVYDLSSAEKVDIVDLLEISNYQSTIDIQDDDLNEDYISQSINLNSVFWNKNGLVFSVRIYQQSMNFNYQPELKKVEAS